MTATEAEPLTFTGVVRSTEELDAAPVGQAIMVASATVGNRAWVKDEHARWQWEGTSVQSHAFIGGIMAGYVTWHTVLPAFSVNQVLAVGRYTYIVYEVLPDGRAKIAAFRDGNWAGWDEANPQFLQRGDVTASTLDERMQPAWVTSMLAPLSQERDRLIEARDERDRSYRTAVNDRDQAMRERNAAQQEARELRARQVTVPVNLRDALWAYAGEVDDEQFDDLLRSYDIPRKEMVNVTVTVIGTNYVTVTEADAARALGLSVRQITGIEDSSQVRWRKEFTVSREIDAGSCACEEVQDADDDVCDQVPSDSDSWEIDATTCGND